MIRLHPSGHEASASDEIPAAAELERVICTRFEAADGVIRLAVSEKTVRDLRKNAAIEVLFDPPRPLTLQLNGRSLRVRAVLVPLTGELASDRTTLFYAVGDHYASGPLTRSEDVSVLEGLAGELLEGTP